MPVIAIYSIKGGVGKTATAVNLSYLAAREAHTLIFDLDPQASTSFYFRVRPSKALNARNLLKAGKRVHNSIMGTDYQNLDLLPAKLSFRNLDLELDDDSRPDRFQRLVSRLAKEYTYLFIDCPPNLTLVSEKMFYAADFVLVPVVPTTLSLLTYEKMLRFFKKQRLDDGKVLAFFSMVESRKRLHRETKEKMSATHNRLLKTEIPYSSDVERMGVHREPVVSSRPSATVTQCYERLWLEIRARVG